MPEASPEPPRAPASVADDARALVNDVPEVDPVRKLLTRRARQRSAALMGIVNVTPNSFYDGGRHETPEAGRQRVDSLLDEGADIVDVGGESSKPGAGAVPAPLQVRRVASAVEAAVARGAIVSIDTASPEVAHFALERGARIVNDVTCLSDPRLAETVAHHEAYLLISHARGHQSQMADFSAWPDDDYRDVVAEVLRELKAARDVAVHRGVRADHVWLDPGLGFSKNARQSLELLGRLRELTREPEPIAVGTGRKSFIGSLDDTAPADRLGGTIAASLLAVQRGARLLRVHDVRETKQALRVAAAAEEPPPR